ncbi:hypothetical protein RB653_004421 [Dictyostelium firmibasis]|uniref:Aminoglycoside phosphotransferase domain-containing protein n=1 Tax=Dictyostelium firmibasis TaxID=79012 RepID=A0AAN7U633_9MYCE
MDTLKVYNEYYFGRIYRKIKKSIGFQHQSVIYGDELTLEFIQSIFNNRYEGGNVIDFSIDEKSLDGGLNSSIQRIRLKWEKQPRECTNFQVLPDTVILKSVIESFERIKFSIQHSQSREADFYQYHLSSLLSNKNTNNTNSSNKMKYPFVPIVYYSNKTYCGSFSMILQDISPPPKPSSTTANTTISSYILGSLAMGNQCWGVPSGIDISGYDISWIVENCFIETSKLHIDYWRDKEILFQQQQENLNNNDLSWLKNLDYYNGLGRDKYINYFEIKLKETWEKITLPLIEKLNNENKLKHVDLYKQVVVNEYFQTFIKWESFQKRIDINKSDTPFTMVHGDFHAGNIMIPITIKENEKNSVIRENSQIYFLDYSEVGIGCPFSDISQFIISNCSIEFRRLNEKRLFTIYYEKLIKSSKVDSKIFTFDYCFNLYKRGGIEKWIWFNILLSEMVPEFAFIFYFNQLSTFIYDHYNLNLLK